MYRQRKNNIKLEFPCDLNKGITLIALIISIIVMLILLAVTLSISKEQGLITRVKEATTKNQIEMEKEELMLVVLGTLSKDGKVQYDKLDSKLPEEWRKENKEDGVYISPKGNKYKVDIDGKITYQGKNESEETDKLTELEKYILGKNGEGRILYDEEKNGILDNETLTFKQDPENINSTTYENVKFAGAEDLKKNETKGEVFIRYINDVYKVTTRVYNEKRKTVKGSLIKVKTINPNEGKYVKYKGKDWIVLYDNSDKVELISAKAVGKNYLGHKDEEVAGNSDFEKGKMSYNNMVNKLIKICMQETEITTKIRNVGGPETDTTTSTITLERLKELNINLNAGKENIVRELINGLKEEEKNYLEDYVQMGALGILVADNGVTYWLSSRFLDVYSGYAFFKARYIGNGGRLYSSWLCEVNFMGGSGGNGNIEAVRPVISLQAEILEGKSGEGSKKNPIIIE